MKIKLPHKGTMQFTISNNQLKNLTDKYKSDKLFMVINGCLTDSFYAPYRSIQKSIIRQLLAKLELQFDSQALSVSMDVRYETEDVLIEWNAWIPEIEIEDKKTEETTRISLRGELADRTMELFYR